MTALSAVSLHNPDPANVRETPTYTVKSGDNLWDIAENIALAEAEAKGQTLSGANLNTATANELALIEGSNKQILGTDGSGTYDLIYPGDKIALPVQTPGTSFANVPKPEPTGTTGFKPPTQLPGPVGGTQMQPGQDVLSTNGKYDLVLGDNGDLVLYKLNTPYERPQNYAPGPNGPTVVWQSNTSQPVTSAVPGANGVEMYSADGNPLGSISDARLSALMDGGKLSSLTKGGSLTG
jgi:hypothetical protein